MSLLRQLMRLPLSRGLWSRWPVGSVEKKVFYGIYPYPHYAYGLYWAAYQASRLDIPRITAIEFGVAGGRGLLAMERASVEVERAVGVKIDVIGFDAGSGMPEPEDYRDLPHIWGKGFYQMDVAKLKARLTKSELILGDVRETTSQWLARSGTAPVGFVSFDLDYYSSTKAAFGIFEGDESRTLPRVYCYFDDVATNDLGCMNPYVGELLAIEEYNRDHADRKICRIEQLRLARTQWEKWQDRIYAFHHFSHTLYNKMLIPQDEKLRQLHL